MVFSVLQQDVKRVDFPAWNSYADEEFHFYDQDFVEQCKNNEDPVSTLVYMPGPVSTLVYMPGPAQQWFLHVQNI